MAGQMIQLPIRFYRLGRLYGPGMPDLGPEGTMEKVLARTVGQVGLVSVHAWNLGEAAGPYPIEDGAGCPGTAADWVPVAHRIIREQMRPAMDAARRTGIAVFHLAQSGYARHYPQYEAIAADPALQEPDAPAVAGCVRPRNREEKWEDQYGPDFPGPVWVTHREIFDIANAVRPLSDEPVVLTGRQLNGLCRQRDIDTLLYMGFMADLCLLNISGAVREMASRFGYRCVVLRDCTTAYEFEDTREGQWMRKAAIRLVETDLGYSADSEAFINAVGELL